MHPLLCGVINHNSFPWLRSIRDELFKAERERRQAEIKWRKAKLTNFKDLYIQTKHKVSKLVHTGKCKFYTERITLASSSKELHQIVNTLSNRHPPKILPTNYSSDDLPSLYIITLPTKWRNFELKLLQNKSPQPQQLSLGQLLHLFLYLKKCQNQQL